MFIKRLFLSSVTALLLVSACDKTKEDPIIVPESTMTNTNSVSLSQARQVAFMFNRDNGNYIPTKGSDFSIKDSFTLKNNDNCPILHAINYNGGGFTLVSSDNRLTPILAFSDKGEFSFSEDSSPFGLKVWIESVNDMIDEANSNGTKQEPDIAAAWTMFSSGSFGDALTRSQTPGGLPPEADTLVGPFLSDSWHQYSPYNDYLDPVYYHGGWYQPLVGCVPLAIVRIMRHHQYPSTFLWSAMPDSTPQTAITKSFIDDVSDDIYNYCQTNNILYDWALDEENNLQTGVADDFDIGLFLKNQYGYPSAEDVDYIPAYYQYMRRDLIDHHLPCIVRGYYQGKGHAWICDGYAYDCSYADNPSQNAIPIITTHLHYCWGGTSTSVDGWYFATHTTYNNTSLQYNMKLTRHISTINYWQD